MSKKRTTLIAARRSKGLTQLELSQEVGISRAYLANIERGEYDPSLKIAINICKRLGTTAEAIFDEENARKTS